MCAFPVQSGLGFPGVHTKGLASGQDGWGGYRAATSFPVVLRSAVSYIAAVSRNLEQSGGNHQLIGVSPEGVDHIGLDPRSNLRRRVWGITLHRSDLSAGMLPSVLMRERTSLQPTSVQVRLMIRGEYAVEQKF